MCNLTDLWLPSSFAPQTNTNCCHKSTGLQDLNESNVPKVLMKTRVLTTMIGGGLQTGRDPRFFAIVCLHIFVVKTTTSSANFAMAGMVSETHYVFRNGTKGALLHDVRPIPMTHVVIAPLLESTTCVVLLKIFTFSMFDANNNIIVFGNTQPHRTKVLCG